MLMNYRGPGSFRPTLDHSSIASFHDNAMQTHTPKLIPKYRVTKFHPALLDPEMYPRFADNLMIGVTLGTFNISHARDALAVYRRQVICYVTSRNWHIQEAKKEGLQALKEVRDYYEIKDWGPDIDDHIMSFTYPRAELTTRVENKVVPWLWGSTPVFYPSPYRNI